MDLEGTMVKEIGQTEKHKYCLISLNTWNLKNKTKQKQTGRYRKQTDGCQKGGGRGDG